MIKLCVVSRGAIDPKTHQLDPNAVKAIERRLGGLLPLDQVAAAKVEAMRVDPYNVRPRNSLKDTAPEGAKLRQVKEQTQKHEEAIDTALTSMQTYFLC